MLKQFRKLRNFIEHAKSLFIVKLCMNTIIKICNYMWDPDSVTKSWVFATYQNFSLSSRNLQSPMSKNKFCPFITQNFQHLFTYTKLQISCLLCAFWWTHHYIHWQNSKVVSLSYHFMMQFSLFKRFINFTKSCSEKSSYKVSGASLLTLNRYAIISLNIYLTCGLQGYTFFSYFCLKHWLCVLVKNCLNEAVLKFTHYLYANWKKEIVIFSQKIFLFTAIKILSCYHNHYGKLLCFFTVPCTRDDDCSNSSLPICDSTGDKMCKGIRCNT